SHGFQEVPGPRRLPGEREPRTQGRTDPYSRVAGTCGQTTRSRCTRCEGCEGERSEARRAEGAREGGRFGASVSSDAGASDARKRLLAYLGASGLVSGQPPDVEDVDVAL